MATKHKVFDSRGQAHKRTSAGRVYSHCVAIHIKARPAGANWLARPAYTRAEWASSLQLAERNAASWRGKDHVEGVEIIPVPTVAIVS